MTDGLKKINLISFIVLIVVNAVSQTRLIGGVTTAEVSGLYPTMFTPAGYTFGIWSIIYLLAGVFILYQMGFIGGRSAYEVVRGDVGLAFAYSCLTNVLWLLAWQMQMIGLSMIFILLLACALFMIHKRLMFHNDGSFVHRLTCMGFDIYLGWICAATLANLAVYMKYLELSWFDNTEPYIATLLALAATIIGILFAIGGQRYWSSIAILWALAGISYKTITARYPAKINFYIIFLLICMITLATITLLEWFTEGEFHLNIMKKIKPDKNR